MPYQIHHFNRPNSAKLDILINATAIEFTRNNRGTQEIGFQIPRDDAQMSLLTHGAVVRVYESELDTYLALGQISGVISLGAEGLVTFEAEGLWARLATVVFPENYVIEGNISGAENKGRLTQSYDFRRVTSVLPDDATHDGNERTSWRGYTASGASTLKALLSGAILWDIVREDATEDASGSLTLEGTTDEDGDGHKEIKPFSGSGAYESPIYDFGSAVDDMDRLRFGGSYSEQEVKWSVETFVGTGSRVFPAAQFPTFPDGVGEDLTGLLDRRYFAVRFEFTPNDAARQSPAIFWFEVIGRRDIEGISAGTFASQTVEDNFTVGGETLLAILDRIGASYDLEWRVDGSGVVDVQAIPASGAVGATWGTDRRDTYHFVEGIHCNITAYEKDDGRLTNYLIAQGTGAGGNSITTIKQDASSIGDHGLRQSFVGFNVDTALELDGEADNYLAEFKDPRANMVVDVFTTPNGLYSFEPGDLVSVSSFLNQNHDGNDIQVDYRIIEEIRRATPEGIKIQLRLENKPEPFFEDLGGRLDDLTNSVGDSIQHTQQGRIITPQRTDGSIYDEDIHLGFTPTEEASGAVVLAIEDITAGTFYGPEESLTVVRVVDVRVLERTLTVRYERTSGANTYKAHILWWTSGRVYRPSRVGS